MKEVKITAKMKLAIQVLKEVNEGEGAFAREVLEKMEGRTFNSVNATLAAMAGKGFCTKGKEVFGEGDGAKMLTKYRLTDKGIAELDKKEDEAVEETAQSFFYTLFFI